MKTVTIPTSQSPFVVMVNGAKYVYPAGSVQDVPDEVAVVIEAHNKQTAKPNEPVEAPFDCDCGGGGGAQSDWNQTDSSAADFIKNKPFGDELVVALEEQELPFDAEQGCMVAELSAQINIGDKLIVVFDGENYECTAIDFAPYIFFGNLAMMEVGDDTGEPFFGMYAEGTAMIMGTDEAAHIVKIAVFDAVTMPEKYLPKTKLYYKDGDDYLYMDKGCTTKATINDVPKNAEFSIGNVVANTIEFWLAPRMVDTDEMGKQLGYKRVFFYVYAETRTGYTAEYTP